ncbi:MULTISPECIES: membrane protein insertase YidC [Legionella]|uniref:Membrane protein insertase YidC n=1 Tax=Legionella septentrionalis TaxID=2498109 RepID=A0A433JM38_9GAMM|nr:MULTISPECIES: membrane protein insertase YidC [Legionella]MCP0914838.1 membrane protein insertase YidC [Legionella sp. 27cVA30]RUQ91027.1 membrane protein insertase YidC [Legionella septentrionalis]RUR02903.1 membrane protein insertase YidC [Legionella septentrionalis]RUR11502.1 membrane protein insertase YidC [Legionella septentrionalis]RUR16767.1 membrane protein insertase YidC [Legionella septentrionalis]
MDIRRIILFSALILVLYSLWTSWQADYPPPAVHSAPIDGLQGNTANDPLLPSMPGSEAQTVATSPVQDTEQGKIIKVKTDVLDLAIDLQHGDIVHAQLLDYPVSVEQKDKPFTLLQNNPEERYVANSSLFTVSGQTIKNVDLNFTAEKQEYKMSPDEQQLTVTLLGKTSAGLEVKKEFIFTKDSYLIEVRYEVQNHSADSWKGYMNTQLLRSSPKEDKSSMFHIGSFTGASYSSPGQHRYQKVTFKDMTKNNLDTEAQGGWIAMQQHYFLSAWVPDAAGKNRFYTRAASGDYTIGTVSQPIQVASGENASISSKLYIGPEDTAVLKTISPGLELTVDYGWLWFLSSLLFSLMKAIYSFVGNWGWSIVLVTVLIKLAFYRLSATSYKSMANMRKLQPKLTALRERYGDDKAKLSQATMELYRQEKVNPLGGCLPILIQIPVFIALYWVLLESVELRQAPFILWINDLAAADPYHVLPIIMGATMLVQQKLNPAPPDPMQARIMMFLPVLFTALFWSFPAGLVLYWIVNNTLSILQQWYITRKYSDDKPTKKLAAVKSK